MTTQTKLVTYDDYRKLPDDGRRYEIIDGELLMSPSPSSYHQIISSNVFKVLGRHVSEKNWGEFFMLLLMSSCPCAMSFNRI